MSNAITRAARERMARTGEPYTLARRMVIEEREREKASAEAPPAYAAGEVLEPDPEEMRFMGGFLHGAFHPGSSPGPPHTHVHKLPETEEEMAAAPFLPSLTITSQGGC